MSKEEDRLSYQQRQIDKTALQAAHPKQSKRSRQKPKRSTRAEANRNPVALPILVKRFETLEREARARLTKGGMCAPGDSDDQILDKIDRLPENDPRVHKRKVALWRDLATVLNARKVINEVSELGESLAGDPLNNACRAIDAAYFAGVSSLRSLAEIGFRQVEWGAATISKRRATQAAGWKARAAAMSPGLSKSERARRIAKEDGVCPETVRSHLKKLVKQA